MSDVTGNLGGESIRLRGMALEDTQYRIFQEIEQLVKVTEVMAKKQGVDIKKANKELSDAAAAAAGLADTATGSKSALSKFKEGLEKTVGVAFVALKETLDATVRTVRNFDSHVDDSSYAIRSLSQNMRGTAGDIARFAADSVSQLQDQYRAFKQMSDISGVMSSQFDDLRVITSSMGLTMDQYAGLMQENFVNLRTGGNLVTNSMKNLQDAVDTIKDDQELPFIFQRLGINANDYARIILQQTALNRGLNRSLDTYSEGFAKAMQKSVTNAIGLADAFGIQRSQMLDAQRKAQEDAVFAKMFENINVEGPVKDMLFQMSMAMTGGDVEKAKKLVVSTLTDIPTDVYLDVMKAGGGEILQALKSGAQDIQKGTGDLPSVLAKLQPLMQQYEKTMGDANVLAMLYADPNNPLAAGISMMLDMVRKFAGPDGLKALNDAVTNGQEAAKGGVKDQIDTLGMVQRQNIELAIAAAKANKGLNSFGLTLAHSSQIISQILMSTAGGTLGGLADNPVYKEAMSKLNDLAKSGFGATDFEQSSKELTDKIIQQIKDGIDQGLGNVPAGPASSRSNTGVNATTASGNVMSRMITVKTTTGGAEQQIPVGDLDKMQGQYNQGGPTSPAIKSLLGVLAAKENIRVTGINDAYKGRGKNTSHDQGLAVDFTISGDYAKKKDEIIQQLTNAYGLVHKKDFSVYDEANMPFGHTKGAHLHVEFSKEGAAKFQSKFQSMVQGMEGATGPGGNTSAGNTPSPGTSSTSTPSPTSSVSPSTGNLENAVSTAINSTANSVNNTTSSLVAIADNSLLEKFDLLRQEMVGVRNSIDNLKGPLEAATYG